MAKMRAVQVPQAKGSLEIVEREIPEPQPGWVRLKIEACGVCHSDSLTKEGAWPGIQYPRVPGHEVIGVIDKVGSDVPNWTAGQRVGVGWHGSNCGHCDPCRRGDYFACQVELLITGISFDELPSVRAEPPQAAMIPRSPEKSAKPTSRFAIPFSIAKSRAGRSQARARQEIPIDLAVWRHMYG